ncbi:hypothetical protein CHS0354_019308 [Potamilus streckersoni]|uniref:C-type lectin domain-containing protein n=1 Tax=Potamilus streckersoni TaxID=2493646 RepID=A0AAE0VWR0_9BIVA|nr:hypothetical protein CHS0354_019308 [Potamilus streckersoni]
MTWTEASNVCSDKGGSLLTDTSTSILSNLSLSLRKNITSVWVGARNVWNWTWEDGEAVNYTNWGPGEPSVDGDHIIISVKNDQNTILQFTWKVLGSDTIQSDGIISKYICQFDEISSCEDPICSFKDVKRCLKWFGSCYYIGGILGSNYGLNIDKLISNNWDNARLQCENINATLLKLLDRQTEQELEKFIWGNYSNFAGDFWIGATANKNFDNWVWLSGESVVQMKEIASQGGVKNCLLWTHEGDFQPEQCNSSHIFACQYCKLENIFLI